MNQFEALDVLAAECNEIATTSGFWDEDQNLRGVLSIHAPDLLPYLQQLTVGLKCALITSETSELLEGIRHGNPPDQHCPEFSSEEIEVADQLIRLFDYSAQRGLRLALAVEAKMKYNRSRPYKHGKRS